MKIWIRCPLVSSAILTIALLVGCASTPGRETVLQQIAGIPTKNLSSYQFDPSSPLIDRVALPSAALLRALREYDNNDSYTSYEPTPAERSLLQRYLALLPAHYEKVLDQRLVGIYFVNGFMGSGMTDYVLDANGELYFNLILNPETMRHDASEWLTYRESTCFADASRTGRRMAVNVDCGNEYTGLLYVLLHEGAHMIDYLDHATPYVDWSMQALGRSPSSTPFSSRIWRTYAKPRTRFDFPLRGGLHFYGLGAKLPIARAASLYRGLARSPFVSLYGSTNWAEDFAEYVTWYYWTQALHQPYTIQLLQDGKIAFEYAPMKSKGVLTRAAGVLPLLD